MGPILFDDSLTILARTVADVLSAAALQNGTVLRDASGRMSFVAHDTLTSDKRERLAAALNEALGPYARKDDVLLDASDIGAARLLGDPARLPIRIGEDSCLVLDRRIVGSGWLDAVQEPQGSPPRIVFAAFKGGTGRSTALTVTAADMARRGLNVLAIDLDLEAPGLGPLMIRDEGLPRLGVVDFLVENGIGGVPDTLLEQFIGQSPLTQSTGGRVDVIPALGTRSRDCPENVIPKLARALIEDIGDEGPISVGQQLSAMVERLARLGSYDVILLDSRAGLAELTAPAILGLGTHVLLFGTAQNQTLDGFRALLATLGQLAQREVQTGGKAEWRERLKAVYAKAGPKPDTAAWFRDSLSDVFAPTIYDAESETAETEAEALFFGPDDQAAPHWPLVIPFSADFLDFDPARFTEQLTRSFYEQTFRPFLDGLDALLGLGESP